jgi:hypothetical protein
VRDRHQRVDGVQLAAGLVRVVHAGHAHAHLEPQGGVVAERLHDTDQVVAVDVEGDLVAVDDDLLDRLVVRRDHLGQAVGCLVVPAAVGPRRATRELHRPDQAAVAARVAGAVGTEHAVADLDRLALDVRGVGDVLLGTGVLDLAHLSRPFI